MALTGVLVHAPKGFFVKKRRLNPFWITSKSTPTNSMWTKMPPDPESNHILKMHVVQKGRKAAFRSHGAFLARVPCDWKQEEPSFWCTCQSFPGSEADLWTVTKSRYCSEVSQEFVCAKRRNWNFFNSGLSTTPTSIMSFGKHEHVFITNTAEQLPFFCLSLRRFHPNSITYQQLVLFFVSYPPSFFQPQKRPV